MSDSWRQNGIPSLNKNNAFLNVAHVHMFAVSMEKKKKKKKKSTKTTLGCTWPRKLTNNTIKKSNERPAQNWLLFFVGGWNTQLYVVLSFFFLLDDSMVPSPFDHQCEYFLPLTRGNGYAMAMSNLKRQNKHGAA